MQQLHKCLSLCVCDGLSNCFPVQVRLPLLPNEIIFDHVYKEPLIKDDQECCQILMNALQLKYLPERASSSTAKVMVTPRKLPGNSVQVCKWGICYIGVLSMVQWT